MSLISAPKQHLMMFFCCYSGCKPLVNQAPKVFYETNRFEEPSNSRRQQQPVQTHKDTKMHRSFQSSRDACYALQMHDSQSQRAATVMPPQTFGTSSRSPEERVAFSPNDSETRQRGSRRGSKPERRWPRLVSRTAERPRLLAVQGRQVVAVKCGSLKK